MIDPKIEYRGNVVDPIYRLMTAFMNAGLIGVTLAEIIPIF